MRPPTRKGLSTSRFDRRLSKEQIPPLYTLMKPPTLKALWSPDLRMIRRPPLNSPWEKAGPVAIRLPIAAPKTPPSISEPTVRARHEAFRLGCSVDGCSAISAESACRAEVAAWELNADFYAIIEKRTTVTHGAVCSTQRLQAAPESKRSCLAPTTPY
jgi:hypothetical protein